MGKRVLKTKKIIIPIYEAYVTFVYSNSYEAIEEYMEKDGVDKATLDTLKKRDYEGYHMPLSDKDGIEEYYLIVKKTTDKYDEVDTITHEVSHLVVEILNSAGVKFNKRNDEPYSHLTGYLNKEFFKFKDGR